MITKLTLNGKEIRDLAEAVGLVVQPGDYTEEFKTKMTICDTQEDNVFVGMVDTSGKVNCYYRTVTKTDFPEAGSYFLGDGEQI